MTDLAPSSIRTEPAREPGAAELAGVYDRLHPKVRRWIRDQGWNELREIQARTSLEILGGNADIVIAAATAAGKTEAAFLPILTRIADHQASGFSVLYVSPLKALINDQFRRLEQLCEAMEIPVVKWHGDASQSGKQKARKRPEGIALITPESIEAMLIRRPADAQRMLSSIEFIVIDELHSFLQGPRGLHVASLLHRIDVMSKKPARRIGLSATIGDLTQAAAWLRPENPASVAILEARSESPELLMQVRGYVEPPDLDDNDRAEAVTADDISQLEQEFGVAHAIALDHIADHMFKTLRGDSNLVFGGSRRTVESMADRLRRRSDVVNAPNEFYPHHGSLSKTLREELEDRLKNGALPTTAVCTSTLELGIDIGSVKSVATIGAPRSLSSLKQRLGRTGRRAGTPSILRIYVREPWIDAASGLMDELHRNAVRAVAAVRLLVARFVETPGTSPDVASTLVHQIMSVIAERGGIRPKPLHDLLCGPGPFGSIGPANFASLLRFMATQEVNLIEQAPDGVLMLAAEGERTVQSRGFYAVFKSAEEWKLLVGGRTLGTLPISIPVHVDGLIVFAGKRWIIKEVDQKANVLVVAPHVGGKIPKFENPDMEPVDDRLSQEMRAVYLATDLPSYLDETSAQMLLDGREAFDQARLRHRSLVEEDGDVLAFLWRGSQTNAVFSAVLALHGLKSSAHDLGVSISKTDIATAAPVLERIAANQALDPERVALAVENLRSGKFGEMVPEDLVRKLWAVRNESLIREVPALAAALLHH